MLVKSCKYVHGFSMVFCFSMVTTELYVILRTHFHGLAAGIMAFHLNMSMDLAGNHCFSGITTGFHVRLCKLERRRGISGNYSRGVSYKFYIVRVSLG
jgi:hypothetical protein